MPNSSLVIQAKNDMLVALQNDDRIIAKNTRYCQDVYLY